MNPYKLLQIPYTANRQTIRKAYIAQVKKYHPDIANGSNIMLAQIQSAYAHILADLPANKIVINVDVSLNDMLVGKDATCYSPKVGIVKFKVKPYTLPGTILRFTVNNDSTYDCIYVKLNEQASEYSRNNNEITITRTISKQDAYNGITLNVDNFDRSSIEIIIPRGTTASQLIYNISQHGFFNSHCERGMLFIHINIKEE